MIVFLKKLLCITLAVFMLVGFCSCSGNMSFLDDLRDVEDDADDDRDKRSSKKDAETSGVADKTPYVSEDVDKVPTTPKETEKVVETSNYVEDTVSVPETEAPDKEETVRFSLGKVEGNVYTNDFLGLKFTAPLGWQYFTEKQILELNNSASEYYDEETIKRLENANIVYDMYASSLLGTSNVNVNMEKNNLIPIIGFNLKQVIMAQIPTIKTAYENMGYSDVDLKYQKTIVAGKEFDSLVMTASVYDVEFHSVSFCFVKGNYMANVFAGALGTVEDLNKILDCFMVE